MLFKSEFLTMGCTPSQQPTKIESPNDNNKDNHDGNKNNHCSKNSGKSDKKTK